MRQNLETTIEYTPLVAHKENEPQAYWVCHRDFRDIKGIDDLTKVDTGLRMFYKRKKIERRKTARNNTEFEYALTPQNILKVFFKYTNEQTYNELLARLKMMEQASKDSPQTKNVYEKPKEHKKTRISNKKYELRTEAFEEKQSCHQEIDDLPCTYFPFTRKEDISDELIPGNHIKIMCDINDTEEQAKQRMIDYMADTVAERLFGVRINYTKKN